MQWLPFCVSRYSVTITGADLGILVWWGCAFESHQGIQLLVAGKAHHKLGGSGGMLPQENFGFTCPSESLYGLQKIVSNIYEANLRSSLFHKVGEISYTINWAAPCLCKSCTGKTFDIDTAMTTMLHQDQVKAQNHLGGGCNPLTPPPVHVWKKIRRTGQLTHAVGS